jgi:membrane dipeptidase
MLKRRVTLALSGLALLLLFFFFFGAAPILDSFANRKTGAELPAVSEPAKRLHETLWVADLHADSLMWNRSLDSRHSRGLVDIPRMIEGGVALQAFTVVTKVPWGMNISSNSDSSDMFTLLAVAQRWPVRTWSSLMERALYQAERLHESARSSGGTFSLIETRAELEVYLERRRKDTHLTAGYLGIEGAQVLEGKLENVERLFQAGFRMMSPSHFFDTEVGGSAHGENKTGLTPFGFKVIAEMQRLGMLVDLAHASKKTIDDVLRVTKKPVVFSHTGVVATCDNQRNLSAEQLRRTAAKDGLIGIGFFETATCGRDLAAVVRAIRYTADLVGVSHVALGSDFDGFVRTPIDAAGLPALTQALLDGGFSQNEVRLIMGGNVMYLLSRVLPTGA